MSDDDNESLRDDSERPSEAVTADDDEEELNDGDAQEAGEKNNDDAAMNGSQRKFHPAATNGNGGGRTTTTYQQQQDALSNEEYDASSPLALRPVFLGNLILTYAPEAVIQIFERPLVPPGGEDKHYEPMPVDRIDVKRGYAFIFLKDAASLEHKAKTEQFVLNIRGFKIPNVTDGLRAEFARGDGRIRQKEQERRKSIAPSETLFVVNFHEERTRQADLQMLFEPFGELVRIDMRRNYAFVQFATIEQATKAKETTNGGTLDSAVLTVEFVARKSGDRSGFGRGGGGGGGGGGGPRRGGGYGGGGGGGRRYDDRRRGPPPPRRYDDRGPPPPRYDDRGPPPPRYDDRGPPPPVRYDDRGPPPPRYDDRYDDPRGHHPPPLQAPVARRSRSRSPLHGYGGGYRARSPPRYDDRGPPPPRYDDRGGPPPPAPPSMRYDDRGPPPARYDDRGPPPAPDRYDDRGGAPLPSGGGGGRTEEQYSSRAYDDRDHRGYR